MDEYCDDCNSNTAGERPAAEHPADGDSSQPQRVPTPLDEMVYRRLQMDLERTGTGNDYESHSNALELLGSQLRKWRMGRDLNRAAVAEKAGIQPVQLLILENGLAIKGDISNEQLHSLLQWLQDEHAPATLLAAAEACLDKDSPEG